MKKKEKIVFELREPDTKINDIPRLIGHTVLNIEDDEIALQILFGISYSSHTSATNVCGADAISDPSIAWYYSGAYGKYFKYENKINPENTATGKIFFKNSYITDFLQRHGLLKKFQDYVFGKLVSYLCDAYASRTVVFGGRVNLDKRRMESCSMVGTPFLAKYIMKNKIGTITASHVHHNHQYDSKTSFSLQQVFIWSPPTTEIVPISRSYCGIFSAKDHAKNSMEAMTKRFKVATDWIYFKPRSALKDMWALGDWEKPKEEKVKEVKKEKVIADVVQQEAPVGLQEVLSKMVDAVIIKAA